MDGIDPDDPVVQLCIAGMTAEGAGDLDAAAARFRDAWDAHRTAYQGCIAAHYLARHQPDDTAALEWNRTALRLAEQADAEGADIAGFIPSLRLNLAHSHELLGQLDEARAELEIALVHLDALPESPYRGVVEQGLVNIRHRIDQHGTDQHGTTPA